MNSLGLRHTGCRYRRSVPNVSDKPDACDYQSHGPWYRRSVPKSTKWCRAVQPPGTSRPERMPRPSATQSDLPARNPPTPAHGIVEASRAKLAKPRVPVSNQSHGLRYRRSVPKSTTTPEGRRYRRSVPTDGNLARTSPRKPCTPTARYRRSVPSETGQTTCASLQPDLKSTVSPERPEIDRGHHSPSWSVRHLAAPRSVGPAVFLGSPPTHDTHLVPPGVCGSWPLLAVWDPILVLGTLSTRNEDGPSWSVRHLAAPRSVGPAVSTKTTPPISSADQ